MPEGVGYPGKKKRKKGFSPIAKDLVRRVQRGPITERGEAIGERDKFTATLRKARTGKEPEVPVYRRGRNIREKASNLMREVGNFARGKPLSKYSPAKGGAKRPTRGGTAEAAQTGVPKLFGPRGKFTQGKRMSATEAAKKAPREFKRAFGPKKRKNYYRAPTRASLEAKTGSPTPQKKRGSDRLQELEDMGLITKKDRGRFLREEEKRILGR